MNVKFLLILLGCSLLVIGYIAIYNHDWSHIALCNQPDWRKAWLNLNNKFNQTIYAPALHQDFTNWCAEGITVPQQRMQVSTLNQTPTDEADPERNNLQFDWYNASLHSDSTRRKAWLSLNNQFDALEYAPKAEANFYKWCVNERNSRMQVSTLAIPTTQGLKPTMVSGEISGTLRGGYDDDYFDNPVYVAVGLIVPEGQVLTITEGTHMVFSPGSKMIVAGQLRTEYGVRFTTGSEVKEQWGGIHFLPTSAGSYCYNCIFERVDPNIAAVQIDAPIILESVHFENLTQSIAISASVPFTVIHTVFDNVKTPLLLTGTTTETFRFNYLTINKCQQAVINHGQRVVFANSIITSCDTAIKTELSGTTQINYSLLYTIGQKFVTDPTAQLQVGAGMIYADPRYITEWDKYFLAEESPAVNAADPQSDYSQESGYNGGRADLGRWGNTSYATQRPPRHLMTFEVSLDKPVQILQPGDPIHYLVRVTNTGQLSGSFGTSLSGRSAGWQRFEQTMDRYGRTKSVGIIEPQGTQVYTIVAGLSYGAKPVATGVFTLNVHRYLVNGVETKITGTTIIPYVDESQGRVILEAEEYIRQVPPGLKDFQDATLPISKSWWLSQTVITGYVGSGYMTASPDVGLEITRAYTTTSPKLSYTINFSQTGIYHVWLRGYAQDKASDSVYVALDDEAAMIMTGFTPLTWTWASQTELGNPVTVEVKEAGLHTFNVWLKEDGFRLDRMVLTLDGMYHPTGRGPVRAPVPGAGRAYQEDELKSLWVSNFSGVKVSLVYLPVILR